MSGSYEVGYRRPPKRTRFKPGRSGNPKGRPKGTRNLKTDLKEELGERVAVREGAREIRISKQRALVKSQLAKGIKGDGRAAALIFDLVMRLLGVAEDEAGETPLSAEEQEVLAALEQRILDRTRANRRSGSAAPGGGLTATDDSVGPGEKTGPTDGAASHETMGHPDGTRGDRDEP